MNICVYNKTKENVAKALGMPSFSDVAKMSDNKRKEMIIVARKKLKVRSTVPTRDLSAGNPYIMLGRKIDSRGKKVK